MNQKKYLLQIGMDRYEALEFLNQDRFTIKDLIEDKTDFNYRKTLIKENSIEWLFDYLKNNGVSFDYDKLKHKEYYIIDEEGNILEI